jgi:hypothetical protein
MSSVLVSQVIHIQQSFDWVTQVVVPFGAAVIGAVAVLLATRRQVKASGEALRTQLKDAHDEAERVRNQERREAVLDLLAAAQGELWANIEMAKPGKPYAGYGWALMSTEFTHRVLVANLLGPGATPVLADAFVTGQRYNAAASAVSGREGNLLSASQNSLQALAKEAATAMDTAVGMLNKRIMALQTNDPTVASNQPPDGGSPPQAKDSTS